MARKKTTSPQTPRRKKRDARDPEWTYTPPTLSEKGEAFLRFWLTEHPPTYERGLTVFIYEPVLRRILQILESEASVPTPEDFAWTSGYSTHIAGHADLLLFGEGKRAERERVFIELVESMALMAFVPGGLPRLPQICDAYNAEVLSSALALFQDGRTHVPRSPDQSLDSEAGGDGIHDPRP